MKTKIYMILFWVFIITEINLKAQTTLSTISASLVGGGQNGITFNVNAINPITISEIGTASNVGGLTYVEIWYKTSAINGPPTINSANGWILAGSIPSMNINSGPSSFTGIPIPLNIPIPMGATFGFFIGCTDGEIGYKIYIGGNSNFSDANATIQTGVNVGYSGAAPNPTNTIRQFTGSIKYHLTAGPVLNPVANFFPGQSLPYAITDDTVWMNSPYKIFANSAYATRSYWRLPGTSPLNAGYTTQSVQYETETYIDTAKYNKYLTYSFNSRGLKTVKILSINESNRLFLRDTITRYIFVDTPNVKPRANFSVNKKLVGLADYVSLLDLSSYGQNYWQWSIVPEVTNVPNPYFANFFSNAFDQNTLLFGGYPGKYAICLKVWNARGWDSICKPDIIEIINSINMCSGTGSSNSSWDQGLLFGPNGPTLSYTRSMVTGCPGFLLQPCADSIFLFVDRIKMLPSDTLVIHNGTSSAAPILAKLGAANIGVLPLAIKNNGIRGGSRLFLRFMVGTGGIPTPYDSAGFTIRWSIKVLSSSIPQSHMVVPDTIFHNQPVQFSNTSTGSLLQFSWDTDGDGIYDTSGSMINKSYAVTASNTKKICLVTYNCIGSDTTCKNVRFLPVNYKPIARFSVDKVQGFNTDTFYFSDMSLFGPASWKWNITPGANVQYLAGTTSNSRNPKVRFTAISKFTVKLVVSNSLGSDSITKFDYISVYSYNNPGCLNNISQSDGSIGISRVILQSGIDTSTGSNTPCYEWVRGNQFANLYRGKKVALKISRVLTTSPMDRKAWIDFNRDGDFTTDELVMNELNATNLQRTDSILISNTQAIGTGRMRVGVTYAGTQLNPNIVFLGVFKDYNVNFPMDQIKPTISLNGLSPLYTYVHAPFVDPGVSAMDNIEGNISAKYKVIGTVDTSMVGYNTLRYYVTDLYGNTSDTLTRTVFVVINQTGPTITLLGSLNYYFEVYHKYTDLGFMARTNQNVNIDSLVVVTCTIDTAKFGNYLATYQVSDAFGTAIAYRNITVGDTTKPELLLPKDNIYKHNLNTPIDLFKIIRAKDNYWPESAITIYKQGMVDVNTLGSYSVCYDAVDGSNNVAPTTCIQVIVGDFIPPTITLKGYKVIGMEGCSGTPYIDSGVTVSDNYWPVSSINVVKKGTVNINKPGIYYLWYVASDPSGNKDSLMREVRILDLTKPRVKLLNMSGSNWPANKLFVADSVILEDNCNTDSEMRPNYVPPTIPFPLPYPVGLISLRYKVKDLSGNESDETVRMINIVPTGINEMMNMENVISIYPNPSEGVLFLKLLKVQKEDIEIVLFDILGNRLSGKTIKAQTLQTETLDLQHIPKGIYFIRLQAGEKVYAKKLLLN